MFVIPKYNIYIYIVLLCFSGKQNDRVHAEKYNSCGALFNRDSRMTFDRKATASNYRIL